MADLSHPDVLTHKLRAVKKYYDRKILDMGSSAYNVDLDYLDVVEQENVWPSLALEYVDLRSTSRRMAEYQAIILEGAQGIMLDQDHGIIPHTTWGYTTSRNAVELIRATGEECTYSVHYVTRAYQARHGDGPMTGKLIDIAGEDSTNVTNPYQGALRTAAIDCDLLDYALNVDRAYIDQLPPNAHAMGNDLHVTCCDHVPRTSLDGILDWAVSSPAIGDIHVWNTSTRGPKVSIPVSPNE